MGNDTMLNMTTACATCARPVRRLRPRPLPLLLLPAWRVNTPSPAPAGAGMGAMARAGRASALAAKAERRAATFQPVEAVLVKADFRNRLAAIAARRASRRGSLLHRASLALDGIALCPVTAQTLRGLPRRR
jgi:hypothetical protein